MTREIAILSLIPTNKKQLAGREVEMTENQEEIPFERLEFITVHVGYLRLVNVLPSKGKLYV